MSHSGWIKLDRKILECFIWNDKPFNRGAAWVDLLLCANHEDKKIMFDGSPMIVKRGQWVTSVRLLADRWGWSQDKTIKFLKMLEAEKMLTKDSDRRRTVLTIENYEVYQDVPSTVRALTEHCPSTDRALTETNKNDKNDKNDKKIKKDIEKESQTYYEDENLNKAFLDYLEYRKKVKKKPIKTERGIHSSMNDLNKLSHGDSALAIAIINQSIDREWLGFFELKNNTQTQREESAQDEFRGNLRTKEYYKERFGFDLDSIDPDEPLPFVQ